MQRARQVEDSGSKLKMAERILEMLKQDQRRYVSRFPVRIGSRIQVVLSDDIEWIAAAGDYVELHVGRHCHFLRETMNSLEQKLAPARFLRIHRSRIVRESSSSVMTFAPLLSPAAVNNRAG